MSRVGAFTSFAGDLKEVIVGDMVGADYFSALPAGHTKELITRIVTETKEDLDGLASTYERHGVRVHRPRLIPVSYTHLTLPTIPGV